MSADHLHTWHVAARFTVTSVDRPVRRATGPVLDPASAATLSVVCPVLGPTATLTLRTISLVALVGPADWHVADLAGMHGVQIGTMRNALDRLVRFGWLTEIARGAVEVRRRGALTDGQLARLHPAILDQHLAGHPATTAGQR